MSAPPTGNGASPASAAAVATPIHQPAILQTLGVPNTKLASPAAPPLVSPAGPALPDYALDRRSRARGLTYQSLLAQDGPFVAMPKLSVPTTSPRALAQRITVRVDDEGLPLIVDGFHTLKQWNETDFSFDALRSLIPPDTELWSRDILRRCDEPVEFSRVWTEARSVAPYIEPATDASRLYATEIRCPRLWRDSAMAIMPPEVKLHGTHDATANLAAYRRPDSLRCQFGPADTWLVFGRDLCSSAGQNLMTCADPGASTIWFIVAPGDSSAAHQYLRSIDPLARLAEVFPESDARFCATADQLKGCPVKIWICEQKVGDLVLIPPGASYQAINCGGRTLKLAWPRLTLKSLEMTLYQDLPFYQRYCRKEGYRIKVVIEASLQQTAQQLPDEVEPTADEQVRVQLFERDEKARMLLLLYDQILADEYSPDWASQKIIALPDAYVECDFCGANVLQSFFECEEGNTLCAMCYCQGRLCRCNQPLKLAPHQLHPFTIRIELRNEAAARINKLALGEPIALMTEKELKASSFPRSYTAACKLRKMRESEINFASCRICRGVYDQANRYKCKPCHGSYCFGCLLFRFYIHPVYALAQDNPGYFHEYHKGFSKQDYDEWKSDPDSYRVEARANFILIEAALTHTQCQPVVDSDFHIGFLDSSRKHPKGASGLLPPPPLASDLAKASKASKRQLDTTASPATTPAQKRSRKSSPLQAKSTLESKAARQNGAVLPPGAVVEPMSSKPTDGRVPIPNGLPAKVVVETSPAEASIVPTAPGAMGPANDARIQAPRPSPATKAPTPAIFAASVSVSQPVPTPAPTTAVVAPPAPLSTPAAASLAASKTISPAAASAAPPSAPVAAPPIVTGVTTPATAIPLPSAPVPPANGSLVSVLPSISEIFNLLDKENKKRDVLARQRHQQLVQLIQDNATKQAERQERLEKRLTLIEEQFDDLLGDISRGAEAQAQLEAGMTSSGAHTTTSNVRGARRE